MPSVVGSGAALFVRKRTLFAPAVRWMWRSHVGCFMLSPEGRGVAIVVIVALAGLVVLGGAAGFSRGRNRES